ASSTPADEEETSVAQVRIEATDNEDNPPSGHAISMEHIPTGVGLPEWLLTHFTQSPHDRPTSPQSRLMVIHATDAARRQSVDEIGRAQPAGLDPSQLQTIERLIEAVHVDLRLPRMLADDGTTSLLVHAACQRAAADFAFPVIHPIADRVWPHSKSERLSQLHSALAEESPDYSWDSDPGVVEFSKVLGNLESEVERLHPDRRLAHVVAELNHWADAGQTPFTLGNIDGIVALDLPPSLSWLRRQFLIALARFVPLHQVGHGGKFRLGEHGAWLFDIEVCKSAESLPEVFVDLAGPAGETGQRQPWRAPEQMPWHMEGGAYGKSSVHWVNLGRAGHDFDAALALLDSFESHAATTGDSVIIADAGLASRHSNWVEALAERAHTISAPPQPLRANPAIHWVMALANLAHGEEAWSMQSLRALAVQKTLPFVADWLSGGEHSDVAGGAGGAGGRPKFRAHGHARVLEDVARSFHILGGAGALTRWLHALDIWRPDPLMVGADKVLLALEETQWWLRNLAEFIRPLLSEEDVEALDEFGLMKGAVSEGTLPLIEFTPSLRDGEAWLSALLGAIDWEGLVAGGGSAGGGSVAGLQRLMELSQRGREMLAAAGYAGQMNGRGWVEELSMMVAESSLPEKRSESAVELLTPSSALGCKADLVIICGLSSDEWSVSSAKVPWLDVEARQELGILRPDAPLCDARHFLRHLLNAGRTVVVLDPSSDPDNQPCAPLAEWLANLTVAERTALAEPPEFISSDDWDDGEHARRWDMELDEKTQNSYLTPRPAAVTITADGVRSDINGTRLRHSRQNTGLALVEGRTAESSPLSASALAIGWDEQMMHDRYSREPQTPDLHKLWVDNDAHHRLVTMERQKLEPGKEWPATRKKLRVADKWPALTGRPGPRTIIPCVDPRPLKPYSLKIPNYDKRHGEDGDLTLKPQIWSASRLNTWMECPRKGWLERHLRATADEELREDLDARTRGTLYHDSLAHLICEKLDFAVGIVRDLPSNRKKTNLAKTSVDKQHLMSDLVGIVLGSAPWLGRGDAVAAQRRRDLLSMTIEEVESFIVKPRKMPLDGSIGRLLAAELELNESCIIALEAPLEQGDDDHVTISVPLSPDDKAAVKAAAKSAKSAKAVKAVKAVKDEAEVVAKDADEATAGAKESAMLPPILGVVVSKDGEPDMTGKATVKTAASTSETVASDLGSLKVRGRIDRVEILWNNAGKGWLDKDGEAETCPLDLDSDEEWTAKRYVVIRDLKTVKGPDSGDRGKRHRKSLFEEVQLALYARAWELMNPGDRVVGVGITEAGETVSNYVEFDSSVSDLVNTEGLGEMTNFSSLLFRRPGEGADPKSNPFRAWMRQRLSVAVAVAKAAEAGETRPTPSEDSCKYCKVSSICGLRELLGGDK
ncbi:MAG TPA: hypothetical protein EYN88_04010, partial [Candidatus Poseidoniales archaeon]|nr:hypothetical protein [Candidatus Poseidoniales archaeon]